MFNKIIKRIYNVAVNCKPFSMDKLLKIIEDVLYKQNHVSLTLKLPFLQVPVKDVLLESIKKALADLDSSIEVEMNIKQMTEQQREKFVKMAKEGWKF